MSKPQSRPQRTLIFELALPDYYLDDWDEILEFYDGDVDTYDAISNESGLSSSDVKLGLLLGGKDGTWVEYVKARIIAAKVVPREAAHELIGDERLDTLDRICA